MIRFIVLATIACVAIRWMFGKWPWDYLRPKPTREQAVSKARKLLGVRAGATDVEIREAHRNLSALNHPDRGGNHARMQELNAARDILLAELPYEPEH